MTTLYKLTESSLLSWSITTEGNQVVIEHGQRGGKKQVDIVTLRTSKDALDYMDNKVKIKRLNQGYTTTIPDTVPQLPMLVSTYNPEKLPSSILIQPKLDGIRCIATRHNMYTRRNELIMSLPHIRTALISLPEGTRLDGELYCHGLPFQEHLSIIKRKDIHVDHKKIVFHVFDVQGNDLPYKRRLAFLSLLVPSLASPYVKVIPSLPSFPFLVPEVAITHYSMYEGIILRDPDASYFFNSRPHSIQKYKFTDTSECEIIDIVAAVTGREAGGAIFVCSLNGVSFRVRPKMSLYVRKGIYEAKASFIGRWTRVTYEGLSKLKKPLKPRAEGLTMTQEELQ